MLHIHVSVLYRCQDPDKSLTTVGDVMSDVMGGGDVTVGSGGKGNVEAFGVAPSSTSASTASVFARE